MTKTKQNRKKIHEEVNGCVSAIERIVVVVGRLFREDLRCRTAHRGELSPPPASCLPGQTERKPSSSCNKKTRRAKCWMDEPCRSTLSDAPLPGSDLCRCRHQTECTCRCSATQDCFMEMLQQASVRRDAAFIFCTPAVWKKSRVQNPYLACHISSLATRSQDAGWKLFK